MANINENMLALGKVRSVIRDLFEYGNKRAKEIGRENVFDFSLGNPSVPAPECVDKTITDLIENTSSVALHGYTSAQGAENVRVAIANDIQSRFGADVSADDIYMTCGAAASLTVTLNAICTPGDEVVAIAPFFPEYRVFAQSAGAKFVVVPADTEKFQVNFSEFEKALSENTKAVIINTPNNPTGVVLTCECVEKLCAILKAKSNEYGHPIYLISDEPYRELVYGAEVPFIPTIYKDTIVCYSYSKSLSLPGERIGYILVSPDAQDAEAVYEAVCGAGRALGYVCAPSLFQQLVKACLGKTADIGIYDENRKLLYEALTKYGFQAVYPNGAFYLFLKSPEPDAYAFCEKAKQFELLLVPGDDFGCPGYVRIAYCVTTQQVQRSLHAFERLAKLYLGE